MSIEQQMRNHISFNLFKISYLYHFDEIIYRLPFMTSTKDKTIIEQVIDILEKDYSKMEYQEADFTTVKRPPYDVYDSNFKLWLNKFDEVITHYRDYLTELSYNYLYFLKGNENDVPIQKRIELLFDVQEKLKQNKSLTQQRVIVWNDIVNIRTSMDSNYNMTSSKETYDLMSASIFEER